MRSADKNGRAFDFVERACPVCGPGPLKSIGWRGGEFHRYRLGVAARIVRCTSCGIMFPNPFPISVDPQEIYGDPAKYFGDRRLEESIESYRGFIRDARGRTGLEQPRILDIGSGRGELLAASQLEGIATIVGLELSRSMAESCRSRFDVDIRLETVEEHAERTETKYDAIFLIAVLDHVYDPDATIRSISKLSVPGTALYIDVQVEPNLLTRVGNSWNRATFRRGVFNLSPTFEPFHVFGFNPASLRCLLGKHGFRTDEIVLADSPIVPSDGTIKDRIRSIVATQIRRAAHLFGQASCMGVWSTYGGLSSGGLEPNYLRDG